MSYEGIAWMNAHIYVKSLLGIYIYTCIQCTTQLCFLQSCSRRVITAVGTSLSPNIHQNSKATPLLLLSYHNNPTQWGHTYILYFDIFPAWACPQKKSKILVAQPPVPLVMADRKPYPKAKVEALIDTRTLKKRFALVARTEIQQT